MLSLALVLLLTGTILRAQDSISILPSIHSFVKDAEKKAHSFEERIYKQSEKYLNKLYKEELRLKRKLQRKDSLAAIQIFGDLKDQYHNLQQQLQRKVSGVDRLKEYMPAVDTLKTALSFLNAESLTGLKDKPELAGVKEAWAAVNGLDARLAQADRLRQFMKERKQILKEQLDRFGMAKELARYNKQVFYYSQQIKEYKTLLKDPQKREQKALELITKIPAFQQFFKEHSEIAQLFPVPDNNGTAMALQGLQTRASVQALLQQQLQGAGPNAQQIVQQGIQQAQATMNQWKNRVNRMGGMSSDEEVPDFKPNTQKSKSFWKRVEFGTNLQNTRSNSFLPATTDLGISLGYKLNDRSVIGIGASGKIGWGKDLRHIVITGEGASLRSFIDWKLKGRFFISGGFEQNYRSRFENISLLRTPNQWSQSGLIGISKRYAVGKKWKGEVKLYYDFLYKAHSPNTQPVLFRVGYGL